jgi:hypothetical protein
MIVFIGISLQLHSILTARNQWLSTTRSIPYWATSVFPSTEWRIHAHTLNCFDRRLSVEWILKVKFKVKIKVNLLLAVYCQSLCLEVKALETHDQRLFPQLNPCGIRPYVTSSLTRRWVCLLWICLACVHFAHTACYRKILAFALYKIPLSV